MRWSTRRRFHSSEMCSRSGSLMWAQVLGKLAFICFICVGLIGFIIAVAVGGPAGLNMWFYGQRPDKWAGVAPEMHLVASCSRCEGRSIAVWQLPGRAKIYSSPSVNGLTGVMAVNGRLRMEDTSDCPGATAGWVLNAVRGASTTVVGQGKLTTRPPSFIPSSLDPSQYVELSSAAVPAGTERVTLVFERLDTSSCSANVAWDDPRLK